MESLCVVGIDNHGLGTGVFINGVTGDRFHLRRYYGAGDAGNGDFTCLIRPVQTGGGQRAALGIYIGTVGILQSRDYAGGKRTEAAYQPQTETLPRAVFDRHRRCA